MDENKIAPHPGVLKKRAAIDWTPSLFLTLGPLFGILGAIAHYAYWDFNVWYIPAFLFFYAATGLSITGGYHRCFAHRAYEARPILKLFYILFGAAAFQNSVIKWATDHRIHHRFVDGEQDPYAITKGFFHAHMGWMLFKYKSHENWSRYSRDLEKDPLIQWQHRHYFWIAIFMGFFLPALVAYLIDGSILGGIAILGFLRITLLHHGTFFINSLCHMWGTRPYTTSNTARDSLVLALFTFGEGYHNFHHLFANDYRNGIRWYHWDPTKWLIKLSAWLGLAKGLRKVPDTEILKAKVNHLKESLKNSTSPIAPKVRLKLDQVQVRIEEAQERLKEMRATYSEVRRKKALATRAQLQLAQADFQAAQAELKIALKQLRRYRKSLALTIDF